MNKVGSFVTRVLRPLCVPRIHKYIIVTQTVFFVLYLNRGGSFIELIGLQKNLVLDHGEAWRLVSWYFVPFLSASLDGENLGGFSIFLVLFSLFVLHQLGDTLEAQLGSRLNTAFYFLCWLLPTLFTLASPSFVIIQNAHLSVFIVLVFTRMFPEQIFYFAFVIPMKARYIEWLTWALLAFGFISALPDLRDLSMHLGYLATYLILFGLPFTRLNLHTQKVSLPKVTPKTLHLCKVCGVTEKKNPQAEFRVCAACGGEVCSEHLGRDQHSCASSEA